MSAKNTTDTRIIWVFLITVFLLGLLSGMIIVPKPKDGSSYAKGFIDGTNTMAEVQYRMEHKKPNKP